MKTFRLVAVLAVVGVMAALLVQNPAPVLALNFLGWQTLPLPLAVWLLAAIAVGALTVLVLALGLPSPPTRSKYRPTAYSRVSADPVGTEPRRAAAHGTPDYGSGYGGESAYAAENAGPEGYGPESYGPEGYGPEGYGPENYTPEDYRDYMPQDPMGAQGATDSEWGDWTQLRSPAQREDWDQPAPRVDFTRPSQSPTGPASRSPRTSGWNWPFGNAAAQQQQQAEESWQDLAEGWDGVEDPDYRPAGASPVDEALEDIAEGWDRSDPGTYGYGYGAGETRRDDIYGPADDEDWIGEEANRPGPEEDEADVVDADYRVIIPPYEGSTEGKDPDDAPQS